MLVIVWILPGEEGREAQAKPGQPIPAHCKMHMSAFAAAASSLGGITAIGRERSFILKQGRARRWAKHDPTQQSTQRARNLQP